MIYLDYNASTPIDPAVAAAMRPFLDEAFGNPSSGHWASVPAKSALENARATTEGEIDFVVSRLSETGLLREKGFGIFHDQGPATPEGLHR